MTKRLVIFILSTLLLVALATGVVGCEKHEHEYSLEVIAPTCTKRGYTKFKCECGESYKENYVKALGHTEVIQKAKEPTCEDVGLTLGKTCSTCGEVLLEQEEVASLGHSYQNASCIRCGKPEFEMEEYFNFILLSNNTYKVSVKNKNQLPKNVVIPDSYDGKAVTAIDSLAFSSCVDLTSIEIPEGILSIGDGAFSGCYCLTSIVIPNSVNYLGKEVFKYCTRLTSVTLGSGVQAILDNAFYSCDSLTSVVIPNNATSIGDYAFSYCDNLRSVKIGNGVLAIGQSAFANCSSLNSVELGSGVVQIYNDAFTGCVSLTSIKTGNNLTKIGAYAFYGCENLSSVTLGEKVESIHASAFLNCYKLVEVINKSQKITVTKGMIDNGYVGLYALTVSNRESFYTSKISNDNGYVIYTDGQEKILLCYVGEQTNLVIPAYVTKIYNRAFYNNDLIESVVVGSNVSAIGSYAFYDCDKLISLSFNGGYNWFITSKETDWNNKSGGIEISLSSTSQNATYFKSAYSDCYWYKK